jgi:acyl dehydratase
MPSDLLRGRITDEEVVKIRLRIGYANPTIRTGITTLPWNTTASFDSIRHYAEGYGDANPLFTTTEYGQGTRWGSQIAPPGFEATMGYDCTPPIDAQLHAETKSALRGVQLFHAGNEARFYRPVVPGDTLNVSKVVHRVDEKTSEFARRTVIVTNENVWATTSGELVSVWHPWYIHAERAPAGSGGKYDSDEPGHYTDEQIEEIEAAYDAEYVRGADTLWWEDVQVGEPLPRMVKGPLTVTDLINLHMGGGWFGYGNPAFRLAYENRKRLRGFYTRNDANAWDVLQRIHWEPELARAIGVPAAYDIGPMRWTWLLHYCSNWAGDDAWVHYVRGEFRRFNYMGDTTWIIGQVVDKRQDAELGPVVDLAIEARNQRGQVNTVGTAIVQVASRDSGPSVPRTAPPRYAELARALASRRPG